MTRMWIGIRPSELCQQHLLGEHTEIHQEIGTWKRHPHGEQVVAGHVEKGQVDPATLRERHDVLADEMERRGMDHDSPLESFDAHAMPDVPTDAMNGIGEANRDRLRRRCVDCVERLRRVTA